MVGIVKVQAGDAGGELRWPLTMQLAPLLAPDGGLLCVLKAGACNSAVCRHPPALDSCVISPCCPLLPPPGKRGGGGKAREQCLFLPYIDAVSVVVAGTEHAPPAGAAGAAEGAGVEEGGGDGPSFLPPNMPGFTRLDLDFICAFTEVGACLGTPAWLAGLLIWLAAGAVAQSERGACQHQQSPPAVCLT